MVSDLKPSALSTWRGKATLYSKGIAMGLIERGPDRMGEVLTFPLIGGGSVKAEIVSPVFYDAEGEKQNV